MYLPAEKTKALTPYDPIEGDYRVRLDANESFLLPTGADRRAMADIAAGLPLNRYPDPLAVDLCRAFAALYGVRPEHVTAGNGSDELISVIMSAFLQKGEKVLTLAPDFSMYRFYTSITETPCVTLDKDRDLRVDIDRVLKTIRDENIRLVIFSNPCNPTSLGLEAGEVRRLIKGTDALVVLDEAYMDFWDQSLIGEADRYDNLILLRTCSKALGLAALRLGFAVANPKLTGILRAAKSPYNVNALTQALAQVVLKNPAYYGVYTELIRTSREQLLNGLRRLESEGAVEKVYDSRTNFAFVKLKGARRVFERLKDAGIIVRCFGDDYLRITGGTESENREVLSALNALLKGCGCCENGDV